MHALNDTLSAVSKDLFVALEAHERHCAVHGIDYTESVFKHFTTGCPECETARRAEAAQKAEAEESARREALRQAGIEKRLGASRIPKRFIDKRVANYAIDPDNEAQVYAVARIRAFAEAFRGEHSGRCLALLGNAGTGKTHLACAVGNFVIQQGRMARFTSVAEINRLVRESKSYESAHTETEVIESLAGYDLMIIDEVGMQSGTDAESRAVFDVFNARYERCQPTILISNLEPAQFVEAVGARIADRVKEDGGEVLLFNWQSKRGQA